jgi:hypothetical protein
MNAEIDPKLDGQIHPWKLLSIAFLLILVALFLRARDFGFYEDDYFGILPATRATFAEVEEQSIAFGRTWPLGDL